MYWVLTFPGCDQGLHQGSVKKAETKVIAKRSVDRDVVVAVELAGMSLFDGFNQAEVEADLAKLLQPFAPASGGTSRSREPLAATAALRKVLGDVGNHWDSCSPSNRTVELIWSSPRYYDGNSGPATDRAEAHGGSLVGRGSSSLAGLLGPVTQTLKWAGAGTDLIKNHPEASWPNASLANNKASTFVNSASMPFKSSTTLCGRNQGSIGHACAMTLGKGSWLSRPAENRHTGSRN